MSETRHAGASPHCAVSRSNSHPLSADLRTENRPPSDCADSVRCRNDGDTRTTMHQELELIENRKTGRSSTPSAKLHQVGGDHFLVSRDAPVDGNQFLPDVAETGASAAIASDPTRAMNSPSDLALLQVQDTLTALHKLAPSYRQLMPQRPNPISSGTTTTKDSALAPATRFSTTRATSKLQVADCQTPQPVATRGHTRFTFQRSQASESD